MIQRFLTEVERYSFSILNSNVIAYCVITVLISVDTVIIPFLVILVIQ